MGLTIEKKSENKRVFAHDTHATSAQKTYSYTKALTNASMLVRMALALVSRVCIYMYTQGTILIAVNPLRKVEDPDMSEFMNRALDPESPHPYAIAEVSYLPFFAPV